MRSEEVTISFYSEIRLSMAFDVGIMQERIIFITVREIVASSYKNRIFMDCGISHIQHIINGIARTRIRSLAIPRRAALSEEAHGDNRCESLSNSIKTVNQSVLRYVYVSEFVVSKRICIFTARASCDISGTFKCIFYFLQDDIKINSTIICPKSRETIKSQFKCANPNWRS